MLDTQDLCSLITTFISPNAKDNVLQAQWTQGICKNEAKKPCTFLIWPKQHNYTKRKYLNNG